ncbi:4Fe-4S binding protein [bacterium]|nr:4Fe-4S binding protein [bacterium]
MKNCKHITIIFLSMILLFSICHSSWSAGENERFPAPDFESGYKMPDSEIPFDLKPWMDYVDIAVLFIALCIASYFGLKKRSRKGIYILAFGSIAYFGFYRSGCVCPVGSIQNVTLSFIDSSYHLSIKVIAFFTLPLVFALFFGRGFCSSVCPLGAIQEVFILKHIRVPRILSWILGIFPFVFLGLAILFVATGSGFIICKYDPFIGFFRLGGPYQLIVSGIVILLGGMFIARPYCRFICPYGVILGLFSFFSKKHLTICPGVCIECKLCENSCPVDAINLPSSIMDGGKRNLKLKHLGITLVVVPLIILIITFSVSRFSRIMSISNPVVHLAVRIKAENAGIAKGRTLESKAFRSKENSVEKLFSQAAVIRKKFDIGAIILGIFLGIIISIKLVLIFFGGNSTGYSPDRFNCISCGRCIEFCPVKDQE